MARQDSNDGKRNRAGITTWGLCGFLGVLVYGPDPSAPQCAMNTPSRRKARHATVVRDIASTRRDNRATPKRDAPMPHEPVACYPPLNTPKPIATDRSEEHTSELQSLMRNPYAVLCLQQKKTHKNSP